MLATIIFATQATLSLVSFGLLARWLIYPRLKERPLVEALTPLLLFHTFRTVGLLFLVPTLVDASLPATFAIPEAAGDMLAVALAFASLVALRLRWRGALALVWLFTIEGIADFANVIAQGLRINVATNYHLGVGWLIPTYGVPVFLIVHLMIIALLVRGTRQRGGQRAAGDTDRVEPSISSRVTSAV
ncbi:MAG TPA: hypothetical protein VE338_16580 [Ktedonobacterales bacterium]|nr:hypothetical protein [Ktedonobacterales bacterium]